MGFPIFQGFFFGLYFCLFVIVVVFFFFLPCHNFNSHSHVLSRKRKIARSQIIIRYFCLLLELLGNFQPRNVNKI